MARSHREWCKKVRTFVLLKPIAEKSWKNLEAWEEAKKEIAKIPEHPNRIPSERASSSGPSVVRRDSTATINGR
jgi:hypothetical protein